MLENMTFDEIVPYLAGAELEYFDTLYVELNRNLSESEFLFAYQAMHYGQPADIVAMVLREELDVLSRIW